MHSNTTLVKVKLFYPQENLLRLSYSNTTLVKVKWLAGRLWRLVLIFKYNSC